MDLQGIGAISAAGVTLATIPVLLITGRWQTRAAVQAAQEAGRAGYAQAQATYSSTLDAVTAQAAATHAQWRRGIQRDAYAAFLLATQRIAEAGNELMSETSSEAAAPKEAELKAARAAVRAAAQIVTLEGPDSVDGAARTILTCSLSIANMHSTDAAINRLNHRLHTMSELRGGGINTVTRDRARRLIRATARLRLAITVNPPPNSNIDDYRHLPPATMPTDVADAATEARAALSSFPDRTFNSEERGALSDMQFRGHWMQHPGYMGRQRELEQAHVDFLREVRAALGSAEPGV